MHYFSYDVSRCHWRSKICQEGKVFKRDNKLPVNRDFRHKQSNHKTDQSMKTYQSAKLFRQMPNYSCLTNYIYNIGV